MNNHINTLPDLSPAENAAAVTGLEPHSHNPWY